MADWNLDEWNALEVELHPEVPRVKQQEVREAGDEGEGRKAARSAGPPKFSSPPCRTPEFGATTPEFGELVESLGPGRLTPPSSPTPHPSRTSPHSFSTTRRTGKAQGDSSTTRPARRPTPVATVAPMTTGESCATAARPRPHRHSPPSAAALRSCN